MKKIIFFVLMCFVLNGCGEKHEETVRIDTIENSTETSTLEMEDKDILEQTEVSEVAQAENKFKEILALETTETLVKIVVADFDDDGQVEAFAITAEPDMYASFLVDPELSEGCMSSSFWYLSGEICTNIYFEDKDAFITLDYGILDDGTKYVMVEDWRSAHSRDDSLYTVENNTYKLMFTLPSITINDDGTISSYDGTYSNEGYVEKVTVYAYLNGELVTIIE